MKTYTPGPWHLFAAPMSGNDLKPRIQICGPKWAGNAYGAQACPLVATFLDDPKAADARLIAAAPELLAAMQATHEAACNALRPYSDSEIAETWQLKELDDARKAALAAIAKATA